MIGILVVSHAGLADALLAATEHVVGPLPGARALGVEACDDLDAKRIEIERAIGELDAGSGVAVVLDLHGSSPCNQSLLAASKLGTATEVLTGANLPMLVSLAKNRRLPLAEAATRAIEAGRKYVMRNPG